MNISYPKKLQSGDEIRIISPSRSLSIVSKHDQQVATQRLQDLGFNVSFGRHVDEIDEFQSSSIESRISDLHQAFSDKRVKGIISVLGGFNANQLLPYIDWSLIKENPKVFCGFSDITALNNAILAKTGLVTYSGLHYSSFGMELYFDYCLDYFKRCLLDDAPMDVQPSKIWTDDDWFIDQNDRKPIENEGWLVINEGQASGSIRGGNLCTFNLLQGTPYMPGLQGTILFVEDDNESLAHHFDRDLVSLIQQPGFADVKALLIGRFQQASALNQDVIRKIIKTKKEITNIPVIANVDFGHTNTMITYPIGGEAIINAHKDSPSILITKH